MTGRKCVSVLDYTLRTFSQSISTPLNAVEPPITSYTSHREVWYPPNSKVHGIAG